MKLTPNQVYQGYKEILRGDYIRMIYIPEEEFWMGSPKNEEKRDDDESPQHYIKVPEFYMSQTPITQGQWKVVCEAEMPSDLELDLDPDPSYHKEPYGEGEKEIDRWQRPVEQVSWQDAIKFCARLSILTGKNYRLPTEAEWEYGCRAVTRQKAEDSVEMQSLRPDNQELTLENWNNNYHQPFHSGKFLTSELANYAANNTYADEQKGRYRGETTPVKSFPPNAFGLYDMHGNVYEWCLDPWHDSYEDAPNDGSVWDEKNKNENLYQKLLNNIDILLSDSRRHIIRGGSWYHFPRYCRSASRNYDFPYKVNYYYGFRVACTPQT